MVKPAFIGYRISQEFQEIDMTPAEILATVDLIKSDLRVAETKLSSCTSSNDQLMSDLSIEKNNSLTIMREKDDLKLDYEGQIKELNYELENVQKESEAAVTAAEAELNQEKVNSEKLLNDFEALGKNSADNICCKMKVDNSDIDSYMVSGNKVVCTIGEENKLIC